ncbi:MAG TPA: hypothetical protein VLL08_33300 [Kineosporiaceae bacterium]|nr:hypothetical protein [Kineosporiaceae bacterium]
MEPRATLRPESLAAADYVTAVTHEGCATSATHQDHPTGATHRATGARQSRAPTRQGRTTRRYRITTNAAVAFVQVFIEPGSSLACRRHVHGG